MAQRPRWRRRKNPRRSRPRRSRRPRFRHLPMPLLRRCRGEGENPISRISLGLLEANFFQQYLKNPKTSHSDDSKFVFFFLNEALALPGQWRWFREGGLGWCFFNVSDFLAHDLDRFWTWKATPPTRRSRPPYAGSSLPIFFRIFFGKTGRMEKDAIIILYIVVHPFRSGGAIRLPSSCRFCFGTASECHALRLKRTWLGENKKTIWLQGC